jgi:hypothetical protein
MLNVGSRPRDDVMNAHQTEYVAGQVDDWELVNREAHHRMKNTLMLLAASVRRDFKREKINGLSAAVSRFERRIVAFGQLYHLLSGGGNVEAISVADFFEPLCEALSETILEPAAIRCEAAIEDGKLCGAQGERAGDKRGKACISRQQRRIDPCRGVQSRRLLVLHGYGQRVRYNRFAARDRRPDS